MKRSFAAFALACSFAACSASSSRTPATLSATTGSTQQESADESGGSVRWIGGPTAILERGGMRVLTDPMLGERGENAFVLARHPSSGVLNAPIARYTAPSAVAVDSLDLVIISHTHPDHVDVRAKQLLPKQLPVIVAAAGAEALRTAGFSDVRPIDWGESLAFSVRGATLHVTAVPAHHAHDAQLDLELGRGNGYILDFRDPRGSYRMYWTGDAVLSEESKTLAERYGPIDLLLPHMGGVGGDGGLGLRTMNAVEALELTRRIDPRLVLPIHHTTFAHYREPIEALEQRAHESGQSPRFRFLREGETTRLPATAAPTDSRSE